MESRELTTKQRQVLQFIRRSLGTRGYAPTMREIGAHFGIRSTNAVSDHIRALVGKGALRRAKGRSRTLVPVEAVATEPRLPERRDVTTTWRVVSVDGEEAARARGLREVPRLGEIAAGRPILAVENREGEVFVDQRMLGTTKPVFALRVQGDSMIDDGIFDGDTVFVKQQSQADRGEIVVVSIEGEVTLKRYFPEEDVVRLQPANAQMKPILVRRRDFRSSSILGVLVAVYRKV